MLLHLLLIFLDCASSGDVKPREELYIPDYNIYHNLSTITKDINALSAKYPKYLEVDNAFQSRHGQSQLLLRLTNFSESQPVVARRKILLSYGEHAREFFPIESLFHLLRNITKGSTMPKDSDAFKFSSTILNSIDLYVVAMMNPDGRQYVENSRNYCWRGTETGVDLNRNFDWQFGGKGSSGDKRDEEYRGPYPFSEPEGRILRTLSDSIKFDAFVSLHSGIRQIYVPYADTASKASDRQPSNIDNMLELAKAMSEATSQVFSYGLAYRLNDYTADGTIFDYMAGRKKIPFSFAIELWGNGDSKGAQCFDLFNPKSQDLKKAVAEVHPLYVTFFQYLINWQPPVPVSPVRLHSVDLHRNVSPLAYLFLMALVLVSLAFYFHQHLPTCLRHRHRRIISLRSLSSTFATMSLVKHT